MEPYNVTKEIFDVLKEDFSIKYSKIYEKVGVSEQTGINYRKGQTRPLEKSREIIYKGITEMLSSEQQESFAEKLKNRFNNAGNLVKEHLRQKKNLNDILEYLYVDFEKDINEDSKFKLLNCSDNEELLRQIIFEKLQISEKTSLNFQVRKLEDSDEIWNKREFACIMNPGHCLLLKVLKRGKSDTYNILVNFNYNSEEYKKVNTVLRLEDVKKSSTVNMILIFSNIHIPDEDLERCMEREIYIENIRNADVNRKRGKDYIFTKTDDKNLELAANQYSDMIIGKIKKYFSAVFKNILFENEKYSGNKQNPFVYWEPKYATRHHINFQTKRLEEYMNAERNQASDMAVVAIGFWSFPSVLRLEKYFRHIYLLDNSNKCITCYSEYLKKNHPQIAQKTSFITFTSTIFKYITDKYNLYHSVDFVIMGTGAGSFVKDIQTYYKMINQWMKTGGKFYVSFLNKEFPYEYIDNNSLEENIGYIPGADQTSVLAAPLNSSEKYGIYCSLCSCNELKDVAKKYFRILRLYSYPLLPLLQNEHKKRLQNILKEYDKAYSNSGFTERTYSDGRGYYVDAMLEKVNGERIEIRQAADVYENIKYKTVNGEVGSEEKYWKTLLVTEVRTMGGKGKGSYFSDITVVILPNYKRLPETDSGQIVLGNKKFRLLDIYEINLLGIEYKNISPFIFSKDHALQIKYCYDLQLEEASHEKICVGTGRYKEMCQLKKGELLEILKRNGYERVSI